MKQPPVHVIDDAYEYRLTFADGHTRKFGALGKVLVWEGQELRVFEQYPGTPVTVHTVNGNPVSVIDIKCVDGWGYRI